VSHIFSCSQFSVSYWFSFLKFSINVVCAGNAVCICFSLEIAKSQQRTCSEIAGTGEGGTEKEKGCSFVIYFLGSAVVCHSA